MGKISLTSANDDYCLNLSHDYAKCSETEISNSPTSDGLLCNDVSHNLPHLHNIYRLCTFPPLIKIMTHIARQTCIITLDFLPRI